jgi:perosamine synthetase
VTISPYIPHSKPWITSKDSQYVVNVLQSGLISKGPVVEDFEQKVCSYLGALQGVALASGTSALVLALQVLNIGHGDDVVLPTYVCRSVLESVWAVGSNPILCDVNDKGVLTSKTVSAVITKRTRCIIAVHVFGHPCDIQSLREFEIPLIEDACQAFGLSINGRMAGLQGDVGILSFNGTKCLTCGEGGMLVTNTTKHVDVVRSLASYNMVQAMKRAAPLSDLQAALGQSQLARFSEFIARRKKILEIYTNRVRELNIALGSDLSSNVLFRFTLRVDDDFEILKAKFAKFGVAVRKGVDELLHRSIGLDDAMFPSAVSLFNKTLSIPFYPALTDYEIVRVQQSLEILRNVDRG